MAFNRLNTFVSLVYRSMVHDEEVYTDLSIFRPERFLTKDGKLNPNILDPATITFGFGRRFVVRRLSNPVSLL